MGPLLTTNFRIYVQRTRCQMLMLITYDTWNWIQYGNISNNIHTNYFHILSFHILRLGTWDAKEIKPAFNSILFVFAHRQIRMVKVIIIRMVRMRFDLNRIGHKFIDKLLCASFSQKSHNAPSFKSQIYFIHLENKFLALVDQASNEIQCFQPFRKYKIKLIYELKLATKCEWTKRSRFEIEKLLKILLIRRWAK